MIPSNTPCSCINMTDRKAEAKPSVHTCIYTAALCQVGWDRTDLFSFLQIQTPFCYFSIHFRVYSDPWTKQAAWFMDLQRCKISFSINETKVSLFNLCYNFLLISETRNKFALDLFSNWFIFLNKTLQQKRLDILERKLWKWNKQII